MPVLHRKHKIKQKVFSIKNDNRGDHLIDESSIFALSLVMRQDSAIHVKKLECRLWRPSEFYIDYKQNRAQRKLFTLTCQK